MQGEVERERDRRWEREQENRQRGRRVRLQFVLGSHSASMHPTTKVSNWTAEGQVGRGRGWGLEENRERGGGREGSVCVCVWKRVYGVQRMQRQTWKRGRLLTSHGETDNMSKEQRRLTLTARPGLHSASAKWLILSQMYRLLALESDGMTLLSST